MGSFGSSFFKKIFTAAMFAVVGMAGVVRAYHIPASPEPFNDITAAELVAGMTVGWNLANTLDATDYGQGWLKDQPVNALETSWGNPVTTKAMITAIKNAGFNTIRIPVTWGKTVDSDFNIRADWMARVTEVVNYAVDNDMYIILNTHHDDFSDGGIFKFTDSEKTASIAAFRKIWEQIADNFKNYDEKLIFEGLNEPNTEDTPLQWFGGTAEEHKNLNEHYQVFVDIVRASGGNNDKRMLMVNTYGASYLAAAVNGLVLPDDPAPNKLIVSIHPYIPYNFALNASPVGTNSSVGTWSSSNPSDTEEIHLAVELAYDKFISKGIPVIFGEFGVLDKNNEAVRAEYTEYYVRYARSRGIVCVWWDGAGDGEEHGNFEIFNRNSRTFKFPQILSALMRAAYTDRAQWIDWFVNDDGSSAINVDDSKTGTLAVTGNVSENGWVALNINPDAATLEALKTAVSISFKVKGDGKTYKITLQTSDVTDYDYHFVTFPTTNGVETTVTVNLSDFAQGGWGAPTPFNQSTVEFIQFRNNDGALGQFSLIVSDLVFRSSPPISTEPPQITADPSSNPEVNQNAVHNLTVTASGSGNLSYQWYSNATASNTGGTLIAGAASASFSVPTTAAGTRHYYVVVTNTIPDNGDGGQKTAALTSAVATVTVQPPSSILSSDRIIHGVNQNPDVLEAPTASQFTAGPNPVDGKSGTMNFFWQGKSIKGGVLTIYDASGNIVSKIAISDRTNAINRAPTRRIIGAWDLTDAKRRKVADGTYLVKGTVTASDGKKERVSVMVGVK